MILKGDREMEKRREGKGRQPKLTLYENSIKNPLLCVLILKSHEGNSWSSSSLVPLRPLWVASDKGTVCHQSNSTNQHCV